MSRQLSGKTYLVLVSALAVLTIGAAAIAAAPTPPHIAPVRPVPVAPSLSTPPAPPIAPAPPVAPEPPLAAIESGGALSEERRAEIREAVAEAREAAREAALAHREAMRDQADALREAAEARRQAMAAAAESRKGEFAAAAAMRKQAFAGAVRATHGVRADVRATLISVRDTISKAAGISETERRSALSKIDNALSRLDHHHAPTLN